LACFLGDFAENFTQLFFSDELDPLLKFVKTHLFSEEIPSKSKSSYIFFSKKTVNGNYPFDGNFPLWTRKPWHRSISSTTQQSFIHLNMHHV